MSMERWMSEGAVAFDDEDEDEDEVYEDEDEEDEMNRVRDDQAHLVREAEIPTFSGEIPLREVYKVLANEGGSSFIWTEPSGNHSLVKGQLLADYALQAIRGRSEEDRETAVAQLLEQPFKAFYSTFVTTNAIVPVETEPLQAEARLPNRVDGERVYEVLEEGKRFGWHLNHETLRELATRRIIYVCAANHRNTDPDHGKCGRCPRRIVRTELE